MAAGGSGPTGEQAPSALQMRMRILEMSAVFAELNDGILRAVARRMRPVSLTARDTLRLSGQGGDVVIFLASGQVEESVTDPKGKVLLTRRRAPGDLVILPVPRTADRYVTSIYGLTDSVLLTLDRDGLLEGLGQDLGVNERPIGLGRDACEDGPSQQLELTAGIDDAHTEQQADQPVPHLAAPAAPNR